MLIQIERIYDYDFLSNKDNKSVYHEHITNVASYVYINVMSTHQQP